MTHAVSSTNTGAAGVQTTSRGASPADGRAKSSRRRWSPLRSWPKPDPPHRTDDEARLFAMHLESEYQMKKRRHPRPVTLLAILVVALAACGGGETFSKTGEGKTKLTIVQSLKSLGYATMYVAKEKGYFKQEGVQVEFVDAPGGSSAVSAVIGGSAQASADATQHAVTALEKGKRMVAFAPLSQQVSLPIVVRTGLWKQLGLREDMPIEEKIKVLEGRTLGVISPHGENAQVFRYLLSSVGADPDKSTFVTLNDANGMLGSLKQGRVDAINIGQPFPAQAVYSGYGRILIDLAQGEYQPLDGTLDNSVQTTEENLKNNKKAFVGFSRALIKAQDFMYKSPDEAEKLLHEQYFPQVPDGIFHDAFQDLYKGEVWPTRLAMSKGGMEKLIDFMRKGGTTVPDDWQQAYTNEIAKAAGAG
ncbi:MAG: hypothetical protein GEV03_11905 [Streptosporangiales bacterium]|nr:hypothetical protein [Streptosporangiales bacterium]